MTTRKKATKSSKRRPIQDRSRATVQAVRQAAAQLLVRRGYDALTTNHVARLAGVSIGSVYEYFGDKDEIVRSLLEEHVAEADRALAYADARFVEVALTLPLRSSVERLVATLVALHERDPGLHRVLFEEAARHRAVRARAQAMEDEMAARLTDLLARHPDARCHDPALSARVIVRAVESLVHGWVTRPSSAPAERDVLAREIVKLVLAYAERRD